MDLLAQKLSTLRLLKSLSPTEIEALLPYLQDFYYLDAETIISQGLTHQGLHFILQGQVEVSLKIFGGGEVKIALLDSPNSFGEISLISDYAATGMVVAKGEVSGVLLSPTNMKTIDLIYPEISNKLKRSIALLCCEKSRRLLQYIPTKASHQQSWTDFSESPMERKMLVERLKDSSLENILEAQMGVKFFKDLSKKEIECLSGKVKILSLNRGEYVEAKTQSDRFYGLLWGAVQTVLPDEKVIKISTYGPGELFGTLEFIDGLDSPCRYLIREDAVYFYLTGSDLLSIKETLHPLWGKIFNTILLSIAGQITAINSIFLQLNAEDVYEAGKEPNNV